MEADKVNYDYTIMYISMLTLRCSSWKVCKVPVIIIIFWMLSQEAQFHSILNGDTCDNKTELYLLFDTWICCPMHWADYIFNRTESHWVLCNVLYATTPQANHLQ